MTYEEAHHSVLKEQGMGGMNVSEYEKKLYTKDALDWECSNGERNEGKVNE